MKYQIRIDGKDPIFCERIKEFLLAQYGHLFSFGKDEDCIPVKFSANEEEEGISCYQSGHGLVQEILWNIKEEKPVLSKKEAAVTFILEDSPKCPKHRLGLLEEIKKKHFQEKLLFISLCKKSMFSELSWRDYHRDVTDLIYTAMYHSEYFWSRLKSCSFMENGIESVIPPSNLWNCMLLPLEAYESFLKNLRKNNGYDRIIFETDSLLPCTEMLVREMDEGYCLYEGLQRQCQQELEEYLKLWGEEEKMTIWKFVKGGERRDESES